MQRSSFTLFIGKNFDQYFAICYIFFPIFGYSNDQTSCKHHPQKDLYEVMILKNEFLTNGENSRRQNQKNQQKRLEKLAML